MGEKDSVLLIHGWPDDGNIWRHQVSALLEAGYRVICPDLLGYGSSDAPTEVDRYQLTALVSDMITLLDQLGLEKIHCIAHDYGAVLGWELAAHTERLHTYQKLQALPNTS